MNEKSASRRPVAVIVSRAAGEVAGLNADALRLLGPCVGQTCWDAMSAVPDSEELPCEPGCVGRLHGSGQHEEVRNVTLRGGRFQLSCAPLGDDVITTLVGAVEQPESYERLTRREREVLRYLAVGLTTPEIATTLGIRSPTVRAHVEHMRTKMNVRTRAALVSRAFRMGYLP